MKNAILTVLLICLSLLLVSVSAQAACTITSQWTPSPDAATEVVMLDGVLQNCPQPGQCVFQVPALTGQKLVIRSSNTQGGYVDYEAKTLNPESIPVPASGIVVIITCQ